MNRKRWAVVGLVLHVLIGGLMIFAASGKLIGNAPLEVTEKIASYGLTEEIRLIGAGELIAAVLLIVPRTMSLGTLLVSGFWGGVICIHMAFEGLGEVVFPSILLLLTWLGAGLREPLTFASFLRGPKVTGETARP